MLGHAQSSPMVSGATRWKLVKNCVSWWPSSRLSLGRTSSMARACISSGFSASALVSASTKARGATTP